MSLTIEAAERGLIPDPLLRWGIRRLCARRLAEQQAIHARDPRALQRLVEELRHSPIAIEQDLANRQHYELPPRFFELVLGRHRKYSCCYWPSSVRDLDEAEAAMLELSEQRTGIEDGMSVLDLGCGWGSMSLWLARRHPGCRILAVSNSLPQRQYIESRILDERLDNLEVLTADVATLELAERFDRVVSIEMFEHMRNWERLLAKLAAWLQPEGRAFVHVFCHRRFAYRYEDQGKDDWMARHFFTGGLMPSDDLFRHFDRDLTMTDHWRISGRHYQSTANAWLDNLDRQADEILELFREVYGEADAERWLQRWRLFFLACAEMFGYRDGEEWWVSQYRFGRGLT